MTRVTGHNDEDELWEAAGRAFDHELQIKLIDAPKPHLARLVARLWEEHSDDEALIQVIADELGIKTPHERVEERLAEHGPASEEDAIEEALEP